MTLASPPPQTCRLWRVRRFCPPQAASALYDLAYEGFCRRATRSSARAVAASTTGFRERLRGGRGLPATDWMRDVRRRSQVSYCRRSTTQTPSARYASACDPRRRTGAEGRRLFYCGTPPRPSRRSSAGSARRPRGRRTNRARRSRSGTTWQARDSAAPCTRSSTSRRSSIDHYLGKEACRTSWCSGSPTRWSSGPGARRRSTRPDHGRRVCRHRGAAATTRRPARRDMVQNHLLQVLSFVAMEPPDSLAPEDVRDRKAELLEAVRPFSRTSSSGPVRSWRRRGTRGARVPGRGTVAPESTVETFVALRAWIDNARWKGRALLPAHGQAPAHRATRSIVLREAERRLFEGGHRTPAGPPLGAPHPARRGHPLFRAKEPGPGMALDAVPMDFS